jgi:hypothetical protein
MSCYGFLQVGHFGRLLITDCTTAVNIYGSQPEVKGRDLKMLLLLICFLLTPSLSVLLPCAPCLIFQNQTPPMVWVLWDPHTETVGPDSHNSLWERTLALHWDLHGSCCQFLPWGCIKTAMPFPLSASPSSLSDHWTYAAIWLWEGDQERLGMRAHWSLAARSCAAKWMAGTAPRLGTCSAWSWRGLLRW